MAQVATLDEARICLGLGRASRHVTAAPGTQDFDDQVRAVRNGLVKVRGDLVAFPERFLHGETLDPSLFSKLFVGRRLFQ